MARNPLKQLAGETAVYGLSSILARVLNFLFVPIYTRMLTQSQYGVVTEFMAYIAILQVVLVLGLETGCFRFANKEGEDPAKVYANALTAVFGLNLAFLAAMIAFSGPISAALGYEGFGCIIIYVAGILFCDRVKILNSFCGRTVITDQELKICLCLGKYRAHASFKEF